MKLSERDNALLRVCYEQQLLSIPQAASYFFRGDRANAGTRLRELAAAGLIREAEGSMRLPFKLYRPSGTGITRAKTLTPLRIPQRRRFSLSTLEHDLLVTDVRLRLAQLWDGAWLPERALRSEEYGQIPDGILLFESGKRVAIEVENTAKAKRRYDRIWRQWPGTGIFLVLYVATSPAIATVLRKYLLEAPKGAAFGVIEWKALQGSAPLLWTPKGDADVFSRRSF